MKYMMCDTNRTTYHSIRELYAHGVRTNMSIRLRETLTPFFLFVQTQLATQFPQNYERDYRHTARNRHDRYSTILRLYAYHHCCRTR